jgi:hypothetical protein
MSGILSELKKPMILSIPMIKLKEILFSTVMLQNGKS